MSDEQTETTQQRAEREARERTEQAALDKQIHDTWRAMEKGRLAAFGAMAAVLDKELGENVEPTAEAADWAMQSRARVLDALGVLMLPPGEPQETPLDRLFDVLGAVGKALAENPSFVQGLNDAMARAASRSGPAIPAPAVIDPAAPSRADAINEFIQDCQDPSKVSDDTVLALGRFLTEVAVSRKIGPFAEPEKP